MWESHDDSAVLVEYVNEEELKDIPIIGVILNALNLIAGASLVGLPYALKQSGLVAGLIIVVVLCYYTDVTHQLLVECSKFHPILHKCKVESYEDLVSIPFGKVGQAILIFSVFVVSFGGTVGYLIMIKDALPVIFVDKQRETILLFIWMFFIVPLTFVKNLKSLEYVSGLSVLLIIVLIVVIIHQCPFQASIESHGGLLPLIQEYGFRPNIFATSSIFIDAIAWQHGSFIVFHTLKHPTLARWRIVTSSVNGIACILYACVSIPGYIGYLDDTHGTIFLNLPNNTISNLARAFFSFIVVMTYPIDMLIARDVASSFIRRKTMVQQMESIAQVSLDQSSWRQYFIDGREIIIVMVLNISALTLAMVLGDLGTVLTYTGAIGGSITCFIMPGAVYIGVNGAEFLNFIRKRLSVGDREGDDMSLQDFLSRGSKPWWFRILGFPIWWRLASIGFENIQSKMATYPHVDNILLNRLSLIEDKSVSDTPKTLAQPTDGRFVTSMLLVTFGVVNMIASLVQGTS